MITNFYRTAVLFCFVSASLCAGDAKEDGCAANLKKLAAGVKAYRLLHGKDPAKLSDLYAEGIVDLRCFACPATGTTIASRKDIDDKCDYELVAAGKELVRERKANHRAAEALAFTADGKLTTVAAAAGAGASGGQTAGAEKQTPQNPEPPKQPTGPAVTGPGTTGDKPTVGTTEPRQPARPEQPKQPDQPGQRETTRDTATVRQQDKDTVTTRRDDPSVGKQQRRPLTPEDGNGSGATQKVTVTREGNTTTTTTTTRDGTTTTKRQLPPPHDLFHELKPSANAAEALQRAAAAYGGGKWQEASLLYIEARKMEPKNVQALIGVGLASNALGEIGEALAAYAAALEVDPKLQSVRAWMAELHVADEEYAEAEKLLKTELKIYAQNAWAVSWLGDVYSKTNRTEDAAAAYKTAVNWDAKIVEHRTSNGLHMLNTGQPERALTNFLAVNSLDPANAECYYGLGLCYDQMKRNKAAVRSYESYLRKAPNGKYAATVAKRIEELNESEK